VQKSLLNPSLQHPPLVVISEEDEIALLSLTISYSFHYLYHTINFLSSNSAQKSHVKPQNHLTHSNKKEIELEV
jgi:hypothetical protein